MDDIIDREQRGEATPDELRQLTEWRRASLTNEHQYRQTVQLMSATRALSTSARSGPPSAAAILARHRESTPSRAPRRRWTPWLVAGAAAAGLAAGILAPRPAAPRNGWGVTDITTGSAEMTTLQLGDGSVVRLAPSTRLRVTQSDSTRDVTLDGKAYFVVARMPERPFVVHTALGNARVLGTRFELATREHDLRLIVVEGRVALSSGVDKVEVRGGQQGGVRGQQLIAPTSVANAERMEQWVGKFLVFQSTPVRDVAREIERVYGVHVVITDSVLAAQTVTATFTDQPVARVVEDLCSVVSARCDSRPNEVVMSRR